MAKPVDVVVTEHTEGSTSSKMRKLGLKPIKVNEVRMHLESGHAQELECEAGLGKCPCVLASVLASSLSCGVGCG